VFKRHVGAVAVWVVLFVVPAHAEKTVSEMLQAYDAGQNRYLWELVLAHTENGLSWANVHILQSGKMERLYCPPDQLVLTGPQLIDVLRRAAKDDLAIGNAPYGLALVKALARVFPCRK
jgi:hypothetical protein